VQSGETVALGGLIRNRRVDTKAGLPILHDIPVLGNLFGRTEKTDLRTELLVLLTPRVAGSAGDARAVTDELRRRMRNLDPLIDSVDMGRPTANAMPATGQPTSVQTGAQPPAAAAPAPQAAKTEPVAVSTGVWRVQLAALNSKTDAAGAWSALQGSNRDLLGDLTLHVQRAELPIGTFYRVQAGPLPGPDEAAALCRKLKTRRHDCLLVAP